MHAPPWMIVLATAFTVGFTSPPEPVTSYFGYRWFTHARTDPTPLRMWSGSDESLTVPWVPVLLPGTPQRFKIWTDAPNRTDEEIALYACNAAGCSRISNFCIVATGLVDSVTYFLNRPALLEVWEQPMRPSGGTAGFSLAPRDSLGYAVVTQASVQALLAPVICARPDSTRRAVLCPSGQVRRDLP